MLMSNAEREKRALAILQQLKGMEIAEAQELLQWCSDCVVCHTTIDWQHEADLQKNKTAQETDALEQPNGAGDGASAVPSGQESDSRGFLKSYEENEAWLLDMSGGNRENVERIVADIAAVLDKHNLAHVTATTYRAVMYTLQRLHLARFKDFRC